MQDITEKRLLAVADQLLVSDGDIYGNIYVNDASLFKVGQIVSVSSDTVDVKALQVKRITKPNIISLGNPDKPIQDRVDVSQFKVIDNAKVTALEQKRPAVPEQEIERHTYEEEPACARRVISVDSFGDRHTLANPAPVIISDGHDIIDINEDGSIDTVVTTPATVLVFNEATNVASGIETTITTYLPSQVFSLNKVTFSGNNIATYKLYIDNVLKGVIYTWFNGSLSDEFCFDNLLVNANKRISITVQHSRPYLGNFAASIQGFY